MDKSAHHCIFTLGRELFVVVQRQQLCGVQYISYWGGKDMKWNCHLENAIWMNRLKADKKIREFRFMNYYETEFDLMSSNESLIQGTLDS